MGRQLVSSIAIAALVASAAVGCSAETADVDEEATSTGTDKIVFVAHFRVPCTGVGEQECMMVRESEDAEWEMRYDPIVDFEYEPGFDYRLAILEETITDPPADGSSIRWTLIEAVQKTPVDQDESAGVQNGGEWALVSFGPAADPGESGAALEATLAGLPADRPVTMDLTEPGRVAGHAGCNSYFSDFSVENGHQLTMGPAGATQMACEEDLMALEQAFFQALDAATMVFASGDEMELHSGEGVVMSFRLLDQAE